MPRFQHSSHNYLKYSYLKNLKIYYFLKLAIFIKYSYLKYDKSKINFNLILKLKINLWTLISKENIKWKKIIIKTKKGL